MGRLHACKCYCVIVIWSGCVSWQVSANSQPCVRTASTVGAQGEGRELKIPKLIDEAVQKFLPSKKNVSIESDVAGKSYVVSVSCLDTCTNVEDRIAILQRMIEEQCNSGVKGGGRRYKQVWIQGSYGELRIQMIGKPEIKVKHERTFGRQKVREEENMRDEVRRTQEDTVPREHKADVITAFVRREPWKGLDQDAMLVADMKSVMERLVNLIKTTTCSRSRTPYVTRAFFPAAKKTQEEESNVEELHQKIKVGGERKDEARVFLCFRYYGERTSVWKNETLSIVQSLFDRAKQALSASGSTQFLVLTDGAHISFQAIAGPEKIPVDVKKCKIPPSLLTLPENIPTFAF